MEHLNFNVIRGLKPGPEVEVRFLSCLIRFGIARLGQFFLIDSISEGAFEKGEQLPASAFPKDVDNAGEALASVVPVCLQATLDAVGIAVCQGSDDVIVFGDG